MSEYTFANLSSMEFEFLSRDLLEKALGKTLESFGPGPDSGIDLRYAGTEEIIIQCKHYKDFASLYQELKSELHKVKLLNPGRYIISTSATLVPHQKDKILQLFSPYIKSPADIFGRSDLNSVLAKHPSIENNHYKLWLSSTTVLQRILNSSTINDSGFILEEIEQKVKYYVQNDSFQEAMNILDRDHYVVISGIPGIGKTSLAEMICYDLLARSQAEFISVSNSAEEALRFFKRDTFQVFLFDDFLGSTFLDNSFQRNEDKQLLRLIRQVHNDPNKRLIFTTREYILNQATLTFESLADHSFSKCILDLSKYSTEIKAKILYNHLYFNNVPPEYIRSLIEKNQLLSIINHRNYSPRIIDWVTARDRWKEYSADTFGASILTYFEEPLKIWQYPFENHISPLSRAVLYCLVICGESPTFDNLYAQVLSFCRLEQDNRDLEIDTHLFRRSLKELDNSFIRTTKPYAHICINFQNPSIQDFLISHINTDRNLRIKLVESSIFLQAIVDVFRARPSLWDQHRLIADEEINKRLIKRIIKNFDHYKFKAQTNPNWINGQANECLLKLNVIYQNFEFADGDPLYRLLLRKFKGVLYDDNFGFGCLEIFAQLLVEFQYEIEDLNIISILTNLVPWVKSDIDFDVLLKIQKHFYFEFAEYIDLDDPDFDLVLKHVVLEVLNFHKTVSSEYVYALQRLDYIETEFGYVTEDERLQISNHYKEYLERYNHFVASKSSKSYNSQSDSLDKIKPESTSTPSPRNQIEAIFKSLT